jgi:hypothetical protein
MVQTNDIQMYSSKDRAHKCKCSQYIFISRLEDHAVAAISFVPAIAATDTDTGVNNQITYVLTGNIYIQMFKS